jgi:hypothetical protein
MRSSGARASASRWSRTWRPASRSGPAPSASARPWTASSPSICLSGDAVTSGPSAWTCGSRTFKASKHTKEQLERLWSYTYEGAAARFFIQWLLSLRWQRLPASKKLAGTLYDHFHGILANCKHKVPFGVVEAINGNLRALIRRGRGYQDHEYLILKAQKSTAQARLARAA